MDIDALGLPDIMNNALGDLLFVDCTIQAASFASDGRGGQTKSYATGVAAKGVVEDYKDYLRGSTIPATDRKILILSASTTVIPKRGDRVTIRARTYDVIEVSEDPSISLYTLQAR